MDLVRPLGLAGRRCAVAAPSHDVARYSRFTVATVPWADPWREPDRLLDALLSFAAGHPAPPALVYEGDWDLLLVSRHRDRLGGAFRFVVAGSELVEDLVDKDRFRDLAERLPLPVPPSRRVAAATEDPAAGLGVPYPVVVKPLTRQNRTWRPVAGTAKAVRADSPAELRRLWGRLGDGDDELLVQALVPGGERRVESYHAYVDSSGAVAGEFAGRKIRTQPAEHGFSTALEITAEPDVLRLGRELVERMGLRGVAKLDFKRDPGGRLWLLEVNPRFNLWHHPGARAGVNLPDLVFRDLTGEPRPAPRAATPGVRWAYHRHDARAAREAGIPLRRWLRWFAACEAKSVVSLDDPWPFLRGTLQRARAAATRDADASEGRPSTRREAG
ncbi:MAG: ATP-grasp domain-containing protein [Solirubrobacterales bacterium]|nr:ATP-grasp domain-containing protein [Solirubrobacterales bacterium]